MSDLVVIAYDDLATAREVVSQLVHLNERDLDPTSRSSSVATTGLSSSISQRSPLPAPWEAPPWAG